MQTGTQGAVSVLEAAPVLLCHVLSAAGLPLARRLARALARQPWPAPTGAPVASCRICAPTRLAALARSAAPTESPTLPDHSAPPVEAVAELKSFLAQNYRRHVAHIFIGATGIAVRLLAPLLKHKSQDPPVLAMDPAGHFVISLLSGHWGGGNALARHVAALLDATPVITTASDLEAEQNNYPPAALDLLLRDAGLHIVDWQRLPRLQAALLEGANLALWDACAAVPPCHFLTPVTLRTPPAQACHDQAFPAEALHEPSYADQPLQVYPPQRPLVAVHWRSLPAAPDVLRVAVPRLVVGMGCKQGLDPAYALDSIAELFARRHWAVEAIAALATVTEKGQEAALCHAAQALHVPLRLVPAPELARCKTPNPSVAAGKRFGQEPFSVCEAAALLVAQAQGRKARLILPKAVCGGRLTLAVALIEDYTNSGDKGDQAPCPAPQIQTAEN